ncbi:MAG: DUF6544 family protein [Vicinamibacterales bacterium]
MWVTAALLAVIVLVGAVLSAAAFGEWRWTRATERSRARLLAQAGAGGAPYSGRDLEGLPSPVARFFRRVLREGQPIVRSARVVWEGEFNMGKPGRDNWRPFVATQDFVPGAPGFVWNARIQMLPLVPVLVRDSLVHGHAAMQGAALGLITVVDVSGTDTLAAGALQRYLGEAVWFPTALLPRQGVSWTALDDGRAVATVSAGKTTVSLEFRFDADGHPVSVFAPDRPYDDGRGAPVPRPWNASNRRFDTRNGVIVPVESDVEWQLPEGRFPYWRGRPVRITYES